VHHSLCLDNGQHSSCGSCGSIWLHLAIFHHFFCFISMLGLLEANEQGDLWLYDEMDFMDWVAVDIGHIIEVQELFLRDHSL